MRKLLILTVAVLIAVLALSACGGDDKPEATTVPAAAQPVAAAGDAEAGGKLYTTACVACHGPNAEGVTGLGKNLKTSEFVTTTDDAQMLEFLKKGRDVSDPLNTTGVAMPPKGGNPAISDQELSNIVAYLRSIHQQ